MKEISDFLLLKDPKTFSVSGIKDFKEISRFILIRMSNNC